MLEMQVPGIPTQESHTGRLYSGWEISPGEECLQSAKQKGIGDLKSTLTITHGDAELGV